jgi:hypothetical protein
VSIIEKQTKLWRNCKTKYYGHTGSEFSHALYGTKWHNEHMAREDGLDIHEGVAEICLVEDLHIHQLPLPSVSFALVLSPFLMGFMHTCSVTTYGPNLISFLVFVAIVRN